MSMKKSPVSESSPQLNWANPTPDQWVDREDQVSKFNTTIDEIEDGERRSAIMGWWGGPGIGKSTLVNILMDECRKAKRPFAYLNFKQSTKVNLSSNPLSVVKSIVESVGSKGVFTKNLQEIKNELKESKIKTSSVVWESFLVKFSEWDRGNRREVRPKEVKYLEDLSKALLVSLKKQPTPIILFFDETENASIVLTTWLEEFIIAPLMYSRVVVVWTSRRPWRWKRHEAKRFLTEEELKAFNPEEVKKQMEKASEKGSLVADLFKNVYGVTRGHPFANTIAIREINSWTNVTPDGFSLKKNELLSRIFDEYVNKYALSKLDKDTRYAIYYMSMVRYFDTTMLREILQGCVGTPFTEWKKEAFNDLMETMKKTELLYWGKGFTVELDLRLLIRDYYLLVKPDDYTSVNLKAKTVYKDWLSRSIESRTIYIVEELYHAACLNEIGAEYESLSEILKENLTEYPNRIRNDKEALEKALNHLREEIGYDSDLKELIGEQGVSDLKSLINEYSENVNVSA